MLSQMSQTRAYDITESKKQLFKAWFFSLNFGKLHLNYY